MERVGSFWAYTLSCACLQCRQRREIDLACWIPKIPAGTTLVDLVSALECRRCGSIGRFDVMARLTPPVDGCGAHLVAQTACDHARQEA
ncbi:MAG: hypothetical protein AAGD12_01210 [Pseudomonadota bacterium]